MMKKIWKQAAAILLAVILVVGVAPIGAHSKNAASGLTLQASAARLFKGESCPRRLLCGSAMTATRSMPKRVITPRSMPQV